MDLLYLLPSTRLNGGAKQVFEQADALADRGHRAIVASTDPQPDWHSPRAEFAQVGGYAPAELPDTEVAVATFYTTIGPANERAPGAAVHLCQGYEGAFRTYADRLEEIERAYGRKTPAIVVHRPIAELIGERFGTAAKTVGICLDHEIFRPGLAAVSGAGAGATPRVLVVGPEQEPAKGVGAALDALAIVKRSRQIEIVRAATVQQSEAERARGIVDSYHQGLPPRAMAELIRSCSLLLALPRASEGFGLPLLEALACGVPTVASDTATHRAFSERAGWTRFVASDSPSVVAEAALEILGDDELAAGLVAAGTHVAAQYRSEAVAERVEQALGSLLGTGVA